MVGRAPTILIGTAHGAPRGCHDPRIPPSRRARARVRGGAGVDGRRGRDPVDARHGDRLDHRHPPRRVRHRGGEQAPRGRLIGGRLPSARAGRGDGVLPRAQAHGVQRDVRGELQREGMLRRLRRVRRVLPRRHRASHRRVRGARSDRARRLHPHAPGDVAQVAHHARPRRRSQARGRADARRDLRRRGRSRGGPLRLLQAPVPDKLGGDQVRERVPG